MATQAATPPAQAFSMRTIIAPLVAIIVGIFMVVLDGTAVNVAIPRLVIDFNSTLSTLQWTVTGYALAQAAVIPLAGWLSDRYGAKWVFLASVVLFTLGSVLCSTAQSAEVLVAFRILQGLGGGFVLPVALAYTYRLAPADKAGAVMGMMGIPILFAPAIGPVLAGWLVDDASWRWIFLLNLPIGIIGVLIGLRSLPALSRQQVPVLDLPGTILAPVAFAALVYGVSQGATSWTSANTIGGLVVGAVALVLFLVIELRVESPLLELRVFKALDFNIAIVGQWVLQFALFGSLFLVPQFMESIRGYSALNTGLTLLPQALGAAIFMPIGGVLFDRIGARPLLVVGGALMVVAGLLLARVTIHTEGSDLILPLALYGMGMGLSFMPLNTQTINAAPRALVGRVTALTSAFQQVVNGLTIALLTTFLTSRSGYTTAQSLIAQAQAQAAKAAAAHGLTHVPAPPAHAAMPAPIATYFTSAFTDTFTLMAVLAVVAGLFGLGLRRRTSAQVAAEEAGETATAPAMHMMAG